MPKSRRQESGSNNLARARFAQYTQSSQEDNAMDLSVTRSPDKWRSRMEARSSSAIDDEEFHDVQEADFIPSPLVNVIESPDNLLNQEAERFHDMQEADFIPSPLVNVIESPDNLLNQAAVPIIQDRRNPPRNRVAPHRAGDSQPTPQRLQRNGRSRVRRNNLNRNEANNNNNENQNDLVENENNMEIENVNNDLQGNDGAIDQIENFNAIPNVIENDDEDDNNDVLNRFRLKEALLQAAEGVTPVLSLRDQNIVKKYAKNFVEKIHTNDLAYCETCSEYWFEEKGGIRLEDSYNCKRCSSEPTEIKKMSKENNMSPMWHENILARNELKCLQQNYKLTHTEEALIARSVPIMSFMKLKGPVNGQNMGFSGNVVNILQDIAPLCAILPRLVTDIGIINIRSKRGTDPSEYKDFKVRKNHILKWLLFLKKWNKSYANVVIDMDNINLLPENGSILNELLVHNLHINNNNNDDNNTENNNINNNADDSDDDEGVQNGPINELQLDQNNIMESGLGLPLADRDEAETVVQHLLNPDAPIPWPALGTECIDEYNTPNILVCSFPCYFPFGNGDVTNKVRPLEVTLNEAIKHYNKYSVKLPTTGKRYYPLAENHKLMHLLQDMDERHRIQSQASVYLQKNSIDANLTIDELTEMGRNRRNSSSFSLELRMQTFAANILGSNQYMAHSKKLLLALMAAEGIPTVWFTLSLANHRWEDLQNLFGEMKPMQLNENEEKYKTRCKNQALINYSTNPNLVDAMFVRRVKAFVAFFFGENCLNSTWTWYRYEWQKRGNIHVHGLAKLKSDPGLDILGTDVVQGRKARMMLKTYKEIRIANNLQISQKFENIQFEEVPKDDIHLPSFIRTLKEKVLDEEYSELDIVALEKQMQKGMQSEKKMTEYHDYLITSMNLSNPPDSNNNERDNEQDFPDIHPCSNGHLRFDKSHTVGGENEDDTYRNICNFCERHRHNKGYCLKEDGSCRFGFPKDLSEMTRVIVADQAYKNGENAGKLRRTVVTIKAKSNDKWLNSHNRIAILCWLANMDISLLVDPVSVTAYVAKYASKGDTVSVVLNKIISGAILHGREMGNLDTSRVLRRAFNRLTGRRDKCTQEISHLIMSEPYVQCSHKFTTVNLNSLIRKVNVNRNGTNSALSKNILDLYSIRKSRENWRNKSLWDDINHSLIDLSLLQFVGQYLAGKDSKIVKRSGDTTKTIPVFSPEFKTSKESSSYHKYCWVSLLKYKPWENFTESTFGDITVKESCSDIDNIPSEIQTQIINSWEMFRDINGNNDLLIQEIERMQEPNERIEENDDNIVHSQDGIFEADINQPDYATIFQRYFNDEEELAEIEWNQNEDFNNTDNIYENNENKSNFIKEKWQMIKSEVHIQLRPSTLLNNLQNQQQLCVKTFLYICGLMKNENGDFLEKKIDPDSNVPNGMIIVGTAGTGKSYTINGMINEIIQRKLEKNEECTVLIMAPTGRAAMQANGFTLQCKDGLSIPLFTGNGDQKNHDMTGTSLIKLQSRFLSIAAVIIDEYSMVKSLDLYWVHRRLQQAMKNDLPFGGLPICLVGDPGQLPPVGGLPLWSKRTSTGIQVSGNVLQGHLLYAGITTVMKLTDILRQQGIFQEICLRLRDGKTTNSDWEYLMEKCTEQNMTTEKISRFHSPECIWLYTTNADNNKHNRKQLQNTNQPIALLRAKHDSSKSKDKSTESARKLSAKLYLTRGSKIMLLWNVLLSVGLVNGATGVIIDFIYDEGKNAPELPYAIIIEFNDYKGPKFFTGEGQEKWVPILTEEYKWGDQNKEEHYRIQFPICLAWALTVWKSQGLTIEGLLAFQLGESEKEHGISFVGLSRSTNIDHLSLCGGCSLERLTTKISNGTKLKIRLKEDSRLDILHEKTLVIFHT